MARLNGETDSIAEGQRHPSDQILSPQPCAPPNKEHLLSSFNETSHLHDPDTLTDDGQMSRDYECPSSSSSTRHSTSDIFGREIDDELDQMKSRASSRSSFSSIPASVLIHPLEKINSMRSMNPHEKMAAYSIEDDEARFGGFDEHPKNIRTIRQREAAFRKPSSVRAMQMHTEDEADDDEYLTPPRRRGGIRSPGSSPLKRSPYYSPTAAAKNPPKPKKEYPLVLLHCNLLAPSLPVPGASLPQNQDIVEETLPSEYWKRWRRLQEKVGSGVLRDRGVLISHPEDLYDMLEERLLESLELQRSRLHQGHFLGHEDSGPGSGSEGEYSDREESETDGEQGDECPDCGTHVQRHSDSNRKWEIRVFAANGLMRAGAWAAAWKEMEKVDVEVGLWLPSDVRRALEKRLAEEQAALKEDSFAPTIDLAQSDVDPRRLSIQSHSRAGSDPRSYQASPPSKPMSMPISVEHKTDMHESQPQPKVNDTKEESKHPQIALPTLMLNYVRVLASDRRNIALVLLSLLVVFLAIGVRPQQTQPIYAVPSQSSTFDKIPRGSVEVPMASVTASSLSESAIFVSAAAPSVSVPEAIVTSSGASTSSQAEEISSSVLDAEIRPEETETPDVSLLVSESTVTSADASSPTQVEGTHSSSPVNKEAPSVEPESIASSSISATEEAFSPIPTPEMEEVSTDLTPGSSESAEFSAVQDDNLSSSSSLPEDTPTNPEPAQQSTTTSEDMKIEFTKDEAESPADLDLDVDVEIEQDHETSSLV